VFVWFVVGETENSKSKIGVERVEGRHSGDHEGGNVDGWLGTIANWIEDGFLGGGKHREARRNRRGGNRGNWGGGNEYSSVRGGYEGRGGEEGGWEGGVHEEGLERGENEKPGWAWGERKSKINGGLVEHPWKPNKCVYFIAWSMNKKRIALLSFVFSHFRVHVS